MPPAAQLLQHARSALPDGFEVIEDTLVDPGRHLSLEPLGGMLQPETC